MKSNLIEVDVVFVHSTKAALLVSSDEVSEPVWIPKSACEIDQMIPYVSTKLTLPEPLAIEKGLV